MNSGQRNGARAAVSSSARRRSLPRLCTGAVWLCASALAGAATCTVATTPVGFGAYDTFSTSSNESTGSVTVACDAAAVYSISIGMGGAGSFRRTMSSGTNRLDYDLYTDATRTVVWGDGSGGTSRVNGGGTGATHTVYGRITARQNVRAGSYGDSVTVTVDF